MPIEYSVSTELDLMWSRWWGDVDIGEYRELFMAYLDDGNYRLGRLQLCDMAGVTQLDADFSRIWSILAMVNGQVGISEAHGRCVIHAPRATIYGLARMYQSLAENARGVRVDVFRDEAEVLASLNLPVDSLSALYAHDSFLAPSLRTGSEQGLR